MDRSLLEEKLLIIIKGDELCSVNLPTLQADSLPSEPPGKPEKLEWVAYPLSRDSFQPRNRTRVSCIAGGFLNS